MRVSSSSLRSELVQRLEANEMNKNWNIIELIVIGVAVVVIVLPTAEKSLARRHIDLNGLVTDFIESAREAVQRNVNPPSTTPSPE